MARRELFPPPHIKVCPARQVATMTIALGPVKWTTPALHVVPLCSTPTWLYGGEGGAIDWRLMKAFVRELIGDAFSEEENNLRGRYGVYLSKGSDWQHFAVLEARPGQEFDRFVFTTEDWPLQRTCARFQTVLPYTFTVDLRVYHTAIETHGASYPKFTLGTEFLVEEERDLIVKAIVDMTGFHFRMPEDLGLEKNLGYRQGSIDFAPEVNDWQEPPSAIGSSPDTPPRVARLENRQRFLNCPPDEQGGMVRFPKRQRVHAGPPSSAEED